MKESVAFISACAVLWFLTATAPFSSAQTFTVVASFDGLNGSTPSSLIQGADGNFYGTTVYGPSQDPYFGPGTIFELTPAGTLTSLASFEGTGGALPQTPLIQSSNGTFYGTTPYAVYSFVPGGTPAVLAGVELSRAPLMMGLDGNFYGTTEGNAQPGSCSSDCGTIFRITPAGTFTALYTFDGTGGYGPYGPVVLGTDGSLYGTTKYGGYQNCGGFNDTETCGTIFKMTPAGELTTLYSFCAQTGCPDGYGPRGNLLLGRDGNFYGSTGNTIFKITPAAVLTTLHVFSGLGIDGFGANWLMQASDGNFYGTTIGAAPLDPNGTIFKMTPTGTFLTLYSFDPLSYASYDPAGLMQATSGIFYGPASGAVNDYGTIFSFSIGLGGTTASTTSLSLSPATIFEYSNTPVAMTATVEPSAGSGTPTGVVSFFNGSTEVGSANLNGGGATGTYTGAQALAVGAYAITAVYSGDGTFAMSTSSPQTLTVLPDPAAATPSLSPTGGTYTSAQTVTISDATSGALVFYTTDGSTPTEQSPIYSGPITVYSTETINAIATAPSYSTSAVASATYTIVPEPYAAMPSFSPPGGTYNSTQMVTISDATSGATIYYTNDGSYPTTNSAVYTKPITITVNSPEVINAIAVANGYFDSNAATASYLINPAPTFQVLVISSTLTIAAGQSGTTTYTVVPQYGFDSEVTFSCSGLPAKATCTFNPPSVTLDGVDSASSTLTVSTAAPSAALRGPEPSTHYPMYALLFPCFALFFAGRRKSTGIGFRILNMLAVLVLATTLNSCGNSSSNGGNSGGTGTHPSGGTPAGTSTVTVTASTSGSGAIRQSVSLIITVTQ
jgi:uncharacterized repeat protein (TIGR03803 family)